MKLKDFITEQVDQSAADEVLRGLIAAGDPSAKYFQMTRYDTRYKSVDTAQRAAELMARRADARTQSRPKAASTVSRRGEPRTQAKPASASSLPAPGRPKPDRERSDKFYGNQYTGSLGRGYQSGELAQLMGIKPNSLIGKAISGVKTATKPISDLKRAFQIGRNFAAKKR